MSSANITQTPPEDYVHLILSEQLPNPFYLEIPLRVIRDVCRHPPKYLCYLGWCVLGVEGSLQDERGDQVDPDSELDDRGVYYYKLPVAQQDVLAHAVDLEVIKLRSQVSSQTTGTREGFRQELALRDGEQCAWTGVPPGAGMHVIPWSKGDEWLQLIFENRPHGDERALKSINDVRNGIMGAVDLHTPYFDTRAAVILKTPNRILDMNDVPERHKRDLSDLNASYPRRSRYTLQWLTTGTRTLRAHFPNNSDAAFVCHRKPKPAELLLHYNYGAAAVKHWGRNAAVLNDRPGLSRPREREPAGTGPTNSVGNRATTVAELAAARAEGTERRPAGDGGGTGSAAATDSEQPVWDEDDVMLFFWGNSIPSMERHAKNERERQDNINKWRAGTAV